MKFLIFNIIVFCSLGYLLTSKSNENFKEWLVNSKEKISQITKEEVISTVKKATSKNKEENLVKTLINEDKQQKEKIDEFDQNNKQKNINHQNDKEKENNLKLKKIIDQILAEKKANELKNKKIVNVNNNTSKLIDNKIIKNNEEHKSNELKNKNIVNVINNTSKLIDNKIIKNNEEHKVNFSNKFMTHRQRESALADLIIDMELYHLNSFKN